MTTKRIGLIIALGFFFVWLAILYAGADHPPPTGFLWVVLFDAIAAAVGHPSLGDDSQVTRPTITKKAPFPAATPQPLGQGDQPHLPALTC